MVKRCSPCLGQDVKDTLRGLGDPQLTKVVDGVATCNSPTEIVLCGGKRGGTRTPSAYQQWVSTCMKGKHLKGFDPGAMADCARQWRERR